MKHSPYDGVSNFVSSKSHKDIDKEFIVKEWDLYQLKRPILFSGVVEILDLNSIQHGNTRLQEDEVVAFQVVFLLINAASNQNKVSFISLLFVQKLIQHSVTTENAGHVIHLIRWKVGV